MKRKKKKENRGGARKGAGRKAGPFGAGVVLPWRVPEQLVAAVEQRAAVSGQTPAQEHSLSLARGLGLAEAPNKPDETRA